ncbi:hypothetical protein Clacol_005092, partial [Clathrus columnatus]
MEEQKKSTTSLRQDAYNARRRTTMFQEIHDVLRSHFEKAGLSEHGLRNEVGRSTVDGSPVASQSHPDPNSPSPTDLATTAPASQPQPKPENSPAQTSLETISMLSLVSRRLSDYASPTSSASSQRRYHQEIMKNASR